MLVALVFINHRMEGLPGLVQILEVASLSFILMPSKSDMSLKMSSLLSKELISMLMPDYGQTYMNDGLLLSILDFKLRRLPMLDGVDDRPGINISES